MIRYLLRRILHAIPVVFGVALITFILFHLVGGDPVNMLMGKHASAADLDLVRAEYGLDRPLWQQFLHYLRQICTLDFDRSFRTKQSIGSLLRNGVFASLCLAVPPFLISSILAIVMGMLSAFYRNRFVDRALVMLSIVGLSVSSLAIILFGQYFLAYRLNWFEISGFESTFPEMIPYLLLPWIIWVLISIGADVRFFRTVFLEEMNKDYVRTAYAKGASTPRVLFIHVLRNGLLPIITRLVINIPFLLMGSLLLENFFGIPGLGNLTVNAFHYADWPVVKAVTFLSSLLYIAGHIASDFLYALADPRLRDSVGP